MGVSPWEGRRGPVTPAVEGELDLLSVSQQMFVSVPVFPRPTPWIVAVAVIMVVLGILIIGSVFFTWRLYQDRSRQRKGEFSSAGTSLNPGLPGGSRGLRRDGQWKMSDSRILQGRGHCEAPGSTDTQYEGKRGLGAEGVRTGSNWGTRPDVSSLLAPRHCPHC